MEAMVEVVEKIIGHRFDNKQLLEDALTHSSFNEGVSYERLEFIGDPILSLAISNHLYLVYPDLDPGQLSLLRAANVSTEKLARVAVRNGLHRYVRHSASPLFQQVQRFVDAIALETNPVAHGSSVKAPKILADIVESVAAAVYVDVRFDLQKLWVIIRGLLGPIVTPDDLVQQPQPVTWLYEMCQKNGKRVNMKQHRIGDESTANVFVDGELVASASAPQKYLARLEAAKVALDKLAYVVSPNNVKSPTSLELNICADEDGSLVVQTAKHKLTELCSTKKWHKPDYSVEKDSGPAHGKRFVCAVRVKTAEGIFQMSGDEKSRIRDAENSAASFMLLALQNRNYL